MVTRNPGEATVGRIVQGCRQAIVVLGVALFVAAVVNAARPGGLPWRASWAPSQVAALQLQDLAYVSPQDAWNLFQQERAVFLDARTPDLFDMDHIPGALNVPPEEADFFVEEVRQFTEQGKQVITYCDDIDCPTSKTLARILKDNGITGVSVMVEGWQAWIDAGYSVEAGGS